VADREVAREASLAGQASDRSFARILIGLLRSTLLRAAVTLLVLGYFAATIHWSELLARLDRAQPGWLVGACGLLGIAYLMSALRWWFLLRVQEVPVPLGSAVALTYIAQFFNAFMLGAVGGDVVKTLMILPYAPNRRTNATLSILVDRVLGLAVLLAASIATLPWQYRELAAHPELRSVVSTLIVVSAALVIAAVVVGLWPFHRSPAWAKRLWARIPRRHIASLLVSGYRAHFVAWRDTLGAVVAAFALTFVLIAAGWCIARGIGLSVSYIEMLEIFTVATCVISLPISIGGHGVREGIFVFMFAAYGLITMGADHRASNGNGPEIAILFSLIFFGLSSVWSVVGGVVYLAFKPRAKVP
jgi:uncharacterized protein (TIRG00374 family)